jgi:hypothetical protein
LLAAGVYLFNPDADICSDPLGVTAVVCVINKALTIRGGYANGDWTQANPVANPTLINGQDTRRGVLVVDANQQTALHLEGVIIEHGFARGIPRWPGDDKIFSFGGGMFVNIAQQIVLKSVIFRNNRSIAENTQIAYGGASGGGGLAVRGVVNTILEQVVFENNLSQGGDGRDRGGYGLGGGLFTYQSRVIGQALTFTNNVARSGNTAGEGRTPDGQHADALGGGVCFQRGSNVLLQGVTMTRNQAIGGDAALYAGGAFGGALMAEEATVNLIDASLVENLAVGGKAENGWIAEGGGIATMHASIHLERVSVINNTAQGGDGATGDQGSAGGGGIAVQMISPSFVNVATIVNSVVADNRVVIGAGANQVGGGGGGVWVQGMPATIDHSTIAHNEAGDGMQGQGIVLVEANNLFANVTIANSIIAEHTGNSTLVALHVRPGTTATLQRGLWSNNQYNTNADVNVGPVGTINGLETMLDGHAEFVAVGAPGYNYHLTASSDALDQAQNSTQPLDIDGQSRGNGAPDLGADELIDFSNFVYLPLVVR